ncbi:SUMF1/EgtB/PvdO family nonheme iron enzyme [Hydrogenophaga sp. 5NK40-0174]
MGKRELAAALQQCRTRTLALSAAYEAALGSTLHVPCTPELNPPIWELGHVGWFYDWWLARNPERFNGVRAQHDAPRLPARQASRGQDADALYNSSEVPHDSRWHLPLPDIDTTREDLAQSLTDTLALLDGAPETDEGLYFFRLALFHEDMHAEAAVYMAQNIGFDPGEHAPKTKDHRTPPSFEPLWIEAGECWLGYAGGDGFAFDNELSATLAPVDGFEIDRQPVTWAQFLPFVDSGAYAQRQFWTPEGWTWKAAIRATAPRYVRQGRSGDWERCVYGRWFPVDLSAPASHLTAFEAQAWCEWAGRRLPTEAEWMLATQQQQIQHQRQDTAFVWGTEVWEWTSSPFAPFAGFEPHPYRDYSQPWFADGRPVLKGGSFATAPRMRHRAYRNYFTPERNDIIAGFRSVAR